VTTTTSSTRCLSVLKRKSKHKLHSCNRSLSRSPTTFWNVSQQPNSQPPTASHDNEVTKQLVKEVVEESGGKWVDVVKKMGKQMDNFVSQGEAREHSHTFLQRMYHTI